MRVALRPRATPEEVEVIDDHRNCRTCRFSKLNVRALAEGGPCGNVVFNCDNPSHNWPLSADPIHDWIEVNLDDFDITGMPTEARDCPGWERA